MVIEYFCKECGTSRIVTTEKVPLCTNCNKPMSKEMVEQLNTAIDTTPEVRFIDHEAISGTIAKNVARMRS